MLNLNSTLVYSEHPKKLFEFYEKIFGKKPDWTDENFQGWQVGSSFFAVGLHDQVKGKNNDANRILVNFETPDVHGEFERIKSLGAKVVAVPYHPGESPDMTIATFADPDGNYFQLMSPMK